VHVLRARGLLRSVPSIYLAKPSGGLSFGDVARQKVATMLPASVFLPFVACLALTLTPILLSSRKQYVDSGLNRSYGRTLVVHVFADADPEYLENLKIFVKYGILREDDAEYIILVQTNTPDIVSLA